MAISRILVPTDGSVFSRRAGKLAIEIAKATKAVVIAVHVIPIMQPNLLEAANIEKVKAKQAQACFSDLEEDARSAGVMFEQKMLISRSIAETIAAEVEVLKPDIIVMGSHGLTGLKKILLGSVTTDVLKKSTKPVLVVK